jgi:hypothetical protein
VGILVLEAPSGDQVAGRRQGLNHGLVGVALLALVGDHPLALKPRRIVGEAPVGIDGERDAGVDLQACELRLLLGPNVEVFTAMARRGVDKAGAGLFGNMVAFEQWHRQSRNLAPAADAGM